MSQAKVDKYKELKANRKEIMKKEKAKRRIKKITGSIVVIALLGWLGFSTYSSYEDMIPREVVSVDYTSIDAYMESFAE